MTTPKEIGDAVKRLRSAFGLGMEPTWVHVQSRADAGDRDCYKDVERQIAEFGGEIVYGWQVWEWPRIIIEGEFHAVWRSPEGSLIDVSLKPDGEDRIVFVPDVTRRYEGRQRDNIRLALWTHPLVHRFMEACAAIHHELDENRIGEIHAWVDTEKMATLEQRKFELQLKLMRLPRGRSND